MVVIKRSGWHATQIQKSQGGIFGLPPVIIMTELRIWMRLDDELTYWCQVRLFGQEYWDTVTSFESEAKALRWLYQETVR